MIILQKLKIPRNHSGITKTLRLPENLVNDIQILADLKNISFNKAVIELLDFSLKNLDDNDEKLIENFAKFEKYALGQEPEWVNAKRKADFIALQNRPKEWTLAEDTALKSMVALPREEVARRLGRTICAVTNRYRKLRRREKLC